MASEVALGPGADPRDARRAAIVGVVVAVVLLVSGLAWAKWLPYAGKAHLLAGDGAWSGGSPFDVTLPHGASPVHVAWSFASQYFVAVWRALVVALLVAAAADALVPRGWLVRMLDRRTRLGQAVTGAALSTPSMMCTCCTAPVAVGLRRRGAPLAATLAYWIGNPLLNPAVVVFLLLVLPWQYAVVRLLVGVVLVVVAAVTVARRRDRSGAGAGAVATSTWDAGRLSELPGRYLRSLTRLTLTLVPEYAVVVLGLGLLVKPLSSFDGLARLGIVGLVVVAVTATLLVIPTGGEIPVILAVTAAGAGTGVAGVLLIALPAVSTPSMVMVGRAIGWRATAATGGTVVVGSVLAGVLLSAVT